MIPERPFDSRQIYDIDLDVIYPDHHFNCRGIINPGEVQELAKDIAEKGLTQPVVAQPWTITSKPHIRFRLVAGYRRYTAHRMNLATTIPCVIKEGLSDVDARIINLSENIQRTNLNVTQEAEALEHLKDAGMTQEMVAKRIGKSRGWVQERYYLLELPSEIKEEAAQGNITLKQIRQIWALPSVNQQFEFVRKLKDAKIKEHKRPVKSESVRNRNEKRLRSRGEIFELQEIIRTCVGHSLVTRVLGWAAGEVSDQEVHADLEVHARKMGKFYAVPEGLHGNAKVTKVDDDDVVPDVVDRPPNYDDLDDDLKILFEATEDDKKRREVIERNFQSSTSDSE